MALFDTLAEKYDSWFVLNPELFKSELEALKSLMPKGLETLDIGCGTGIFTKALGIKAGIDPSQEMLEIAKKRDLEVSLASTRSLNLKKKYQLFTMITVDCFIEDLTLDIKNLYDNLTDDGYLLIAFLNKDTPLGMMYEENKDNDEYYKHAYFHTGKEIINYLETNNFKVLKKISTIRTLENVYQPYEEGLKTGVFSIVLARKEEK